MSEINCPRCMGEMLWSGRRSRWECLCGKTIAVTVVVKPSTEHVDESPRIGDESDVVSLSDSLHEVRRLAGSHSFVSIAHSRQWIH